MDSSAQAAVAMVSYQDVTALFWESMAIGLFRCLGMSVYCMLLERSVLTCPFLRSPSLLQAGEETWANRLQSDETVTETQTPVSSFSCCPFLWHWVLSSCTFMSKTMLTLSEHLCVWPCFFCRETESSRFSDAVKTLSAKMNPLADIGEQLRKRMRQEEEQGPS